MLGLIRIEHSESFSYGRIASLRLCPHTAENAGMIAVKAQRSVPATGRPHLGLRAAGAGLAVVAAALQLDFCLTGNLSIPVIGWLLAAGGRCIRPDHGDTGVGRPAGRQAGAWFAV